MTINEMNDERANLKSWFTWYDTQVIQYQRDIRIDGESQINITSLDDQARTNAARIKELTNLINEEFRKME